MSFNSKSLPPPTAEERARWEAIKFEGYCTNCRHGGPVEIHHLLSGGLRVSHLATVGLCAWCHRGIKPVGETITSMRWLRGPSLYHHKREFYERWGSDQNLLDMQNGDIGWPRTIIGKPQRRRPSPTAKPVKRLATDATMTTTHRDFSGAGNTKRKQPSRCTASPKQVPRPAGGYVR